jgi:hypothetical protein
MNVLLKLPMPACNWQTQAFRSTPQQCCSRVSTTVLSPDAVLGRVGDDLLLKNFEGKVFRYRDTLQDTGGENLNGASASNSELNKRRFELIDREIQGTISDSEKSELLQLTQLLRERIDADANLPLQGARTLHSYLPGLQTPNYSP